MSFGDEAPGAAMAPARRLSSWGMGTRQCTACAAGTHEPGELCKGCRENQAVVVSPAFVQSTAADAAHKLERLRPSDVPEHVRLPLARALSDMRRVFDSLEPLIHTFQIGVVSRNALGLFFAHPYGAAEGLGPFGKRRHAERALIEYALHSTDWETE